MEDAANRRSLQTQALFTVSMTVVAFCLAALVMHFGWATGFVTGLLAAREPRPAALGGETTA